MDRKTFIQKTTAGILLGIPAISILGCSGSDDGDSNPNPNPPPTAVNCLENGTLSSVASSAGHSHSLTISKEDVAAGVEKTYDLSLVSGHVHQVTISAAQFSTLKANNSVSATSTSDSGHTHSISVSCA
ncbi:hypothetical protein [Salinimicrobium oceani]|uniref:Uncharacterized protein n=1 Tax=Salinimicrobium oceani TaxID=2722702 RepID=A0ABX1CW24_9FLAO|nr:hypothetical protein [Salinimicrobium oceani]NJW51539.1 hypothetical protein [Salinimicrobium oceani]